MKKKKKNISNNRYDFFHRNKIFSRAIIILFMYIFYLEANSDMPNDNIINISGLGLLFLFSCIMFGDTVIDKITNLIKAIRGK